MIGNLVIDNRVITSTDALTETEAGDLVLIQRLDSTPRYLWQGWDHVNYDAAMFRQKLRQSNFGLGPATTQGRELS